MMPLLLFTPETGVLVLTVSTFLIFVELNRPGMILPGSLGLLGVLLVVSSWRQWQLSVPALLLLLAAALFCLWQLRHASPLWWAGPTALAFSAGFAFLMKTRATPSVSTGIALSCGALLGASTSGLARIAHRARENKGLD